MGELQVSDSGMELRDLLADPSFPLRKQRRHDCRAPLEALRRVAKVFAEGSNAVFQELVRLAVEYCGADSAGISLEEPDERGAPTFRWVAIAGSFSRYINGRTPRFYSPCGTCLNAGRPQLYRVTKPYYDFLGVEADPITDGMLIPWVTDQFRGTIWAISHSSCEAFDAQDYEMLNSLAEFAAIALHRQAAEELARAQDRSQASAARAHELAHRINNPLQSLTNTMFLARQGGPDAQTYLQQAADELNALSEQVRKLLSLKYSS